MPSEEKTEEVAAHRRVLENLVRAIDRLDEARAGHVKSSSEHYTRVEDYESALASARAVIVSENKENDNLCPHGIPPEFCGNCHENDEAGI